MADAIQVKQETSAETQEILAELQNEGHEIEGVAQAPAKTEAPKEEPKKEEPTPETKKDDKTPALDNVETNKPQPKIERTSQYVPVGKHNEERHKRQEAETRAERAEAQAKELADKIKELSSRPVSAENTNEIQAAAKSLAEKHGLDGDFLQEFAETVVGIASKKTVVPAELREEVELLKKERARLEEDHRMKMQEVHFEKELSSVLGEFPELAGHKEDIRQIAFSEENVNVSLRRLALEYIHDHPEVSRAQGRRSAESASNVSAPKAEKVEAYDFENMTEEKFKELNEEELDRYLEWAKAKSR